MSISNSFSNLLYGQNQYAQNGYANTQQYVAPNQTTYANPSGYGQNNNMMATLLPVLMQQMMQLLMSMMSNQGSRNNNGYGQTPDPVYEPPYNHPPTPVCPPPPQQEPKVKGSAGIFGDPKMGLFTPGLTNVPEALKSFDSGLKPGQTITLLNDTNQGGFKVSGSTIQVNPNNANSAAIGTATFTSGDDTVTISGNGDLKVNNVKVASLSDAGNLAPIQLDNGMTVSTTQEIDGANGQTAKRFVITNGEYKVTAGVRQPSGVTARYLDMNFEERTANAADNATGFQAPVPGLNRQMGIADLLRVERNTFNSIA